MLLFCFGAVYGTGVILFSIMAFILTAGFPSQGDSWKLFLFALGWPAYIAYGVARHFITGR